MDKKMVRIQKLIPGTLVLGFQDITTYSEERTFSIPAGRDYIVLDLNLVVSMFQLPGTMALYKKGYFTFSKEDKELVFKRARELSLYYGNDDSGEEAQYEQPSILYSEKEVEQFLRMKRLNNIKEIIDKGERSQKTVLIEAARKNYKTLPVEIVQMIENGLGVQLDDEGDE